MSEPFLGEIRIMPYGGSSGGYIPRGWALCNGAILQIRSNTALYALLGVQYGGNGSTTFALPNLNGRAIVGAGQAPNMANYPQGTAAGTETVTVQSNQLPLHTHTPGSTTVPVGDASTTGSPAGGYFAKTTGDTFGSGNGNGPMAANLLNGTTSSVGGGLPHNNQMPYLALNYFIATEGIFPTRQ